MRAWVAIGVLLIASTAAAESYDAAVPPLVAEEAAPNDVPNYFDTAELGAATVSTFTACNGTISRAYPSSTEATRTAYCGCFADAARSNIRAGRALSPTEAQVGRCIDVTRSHAPSPFARQFAVSTASIADQLRGCMAIGAAAAATGDREFACSCATNAWIADRARASKLGDDRARCAAASRYRDDTGQYPTVRQFTAIRVAHTAEQVPERLPERFLDRSPGEIAPSDDTGPGAPPCSDGKSARTKGSAACTRHGSAAGRRHHRR
jgi:hypothetical protein